MSALMPIPLTRLTGLPGDCKTTQLYRLLHQPALARNIVEKACAMPCTLEAMEARG